MKTFKELLTFTRKNGKHKAVIVGVTGRLEDVENELDFFLNPEESVKAQEYIFKKRRLSFLLGRYAAKEAICELVGVNDRTSVEIKKGVFEQPIVMYEGKEQVAVGIAHTDSHAVAVSYMIDHPLGIDLEVIDANNADVVIDQFTKSEENLFKAVFSDDEKSIGAVLFWTVKEAMAKCIKTGLMTPLEVFELDSIQRTSSGYISTFTNFGQYKALSYLVDKTMLTIVIPKNSYVEYTSVKQFVFKQINSNSIS